MKLKGETIIEVVLALSVGIIILSAVAGLVLPALMNSTRSSLNASATFYVEDGMEKLRQLRDSNWIGFSAVPSGTYCMNTTCLPSAASSSCYTKPQTSRCAVNIDGTFIREVTIANPATTTNEAYCLPANGISGRTFIGVTVNVYYRDKQCAAGVYCHKSTTQTCMSNYDLRRSQ